MKEVIASTITRVILFLVVGGLGGACLAYPHYQVYSQTKAGEANIIETDSESYRLRVTTSARGRCAGRLITTPRVVGPEPVVMSKRMTERDWVDGGGRRAQA